MPGLNSFPEIAIKNVDGKTFEDLFNIDPEELKKKMDSSLYNRVDYAHMIGQDGKIAIDITSESFTTFVNIYKDLSNHEVLYMVIKFIEGYIFGEAMASYSDEEADRKLREIESGNARRSKSPKTKAKKKNGTRR